MNVVRVYSLSNGLFLFLFLLLLILCAVVFCVECVCCCYCCCCFFSCFNSCCSAFILVDHKTISPLLHFRSLTFLLLLLVLLEHIVWIRRVCVFVYMSNIDTPWNQSNIFIHSQTLHTHLTGLSIFERITTATNSILPVLEIVWFISTNSPRIKQKELHFGKSYLSQSLIHTHQKSNDHEIAAKVNVEHVCLCVSVKVTGQRWATLQFCMVFWMVSFPHTDAHTKRKRARYSWKHG